MRYKRIISLALVGLFVFTFLVAVGGRTCWAGSDPMVLKLAHVLDPKHSWGVLVDGFARDVTQATSGRIKINTYHGGQLGDEQEEIRSMLLHNLDMGFIGGDIFEGIEPKMVIEMLPYAFNDHDHAYRAFDGDLGKRLFALLLKRGIRGLVYGENGFRHVTNNVRPINTPADLKGVKLRTPPTPLLEKTFKALGASPVPMNWLEVYPSLKQGVVDGQENPLTIIYNYKMYEVCKYLSLTGHTWGSGILVIDDMVWKKISKEDQDIMLKYAAKWRDIQRNSIKEEEEGYLSKLKSVGMTVNTVDKTPFREALMKTVWKEYEPVFGSELIDLIAKYQ